MATSNVAICNRALQKIGATAIQSLTQDNKKARACNLAYDPVRKAELRKRDWNFAIKRVVLAPDSAAPVGDEYDYQFTLPVDCLRPIINDDEVNWVVEGRKILTNDGDTLTLRYIADITDTTLFDPTFDEALAAKIAWEICEPVTQSNTKQAKVTEDYRMAIADARSRNAFEQRAQEGPEDTWISVRR